MDIVKSQKTVFFFPPIRTSILTYGRKNEIKAG